MTQYLYLIKCQQYYKIGVANDVQSRLAQLSTGNPFELEPLTVAGFDNASPVEAVLHQRFAQKRTRGEWFSLDKDDLATFDKIIYMLGGSAAPMISEVNNTEIEEAEELHEAIDRPNEWDFAEMFADGWNMDQAHNGRAAGNGERKYEYWAWRKRKNGEKGYIYGGRISDLPYPDLDTMRRVYRDGLEPIVKE